MVSANKTSEIKSQLLHAQQEAATALSRLQRKITVLGLYFPNEKDTISQPIMRDINEHARMYAKISAKPQITTSQIPTISNEEHYEFYLTLINYYHNFANLAEIKIKTLDECMSALDKYNQYRNQIAGTDYSSLDADSLVFLKCCKKYTPRYEILPESSDDEEGEGGHTRMGGDKLSM